MAMVNPEASNGAKHMVIKGGDPFDRYLEERDAMLSAHGIANPNLTGESCKEANAVFTKEEHLALNALAHRAIPEVDLLPENLARAS